MRPAILSPLLACLAVGTTIAARQFPPVFRAETEAVLVTATVVNRDGRAVTDLRREELRVFEDGAPQEIAQFHTDAEAPLSAVVVVDTSGSMVDKLEDVEDALRHFVDLLRPMDEVAMVRFNNVVEVVATAEEGRDRIGRHIGRLFASGGTALYDAVIEGLEHARRGRHRKKALVVITDGNDTSSRRHEDDAIAAVRRSEVLVYALGIGHGERGSFGHDLFGGRLGRQDEVDIRTLRRLAEPTGGRAYELENAHRGGVDLIDKAVVEIAQELRVQYTIGYYPTNTRKDGKFRRLAIETTRPGLTVRARSGYWAPCESSDTGESGGRRGREQSVCEDDTRD